MSCAAKPGLKPEPTRLPHECDQPNPKTRYLGIGPGLNWNRSPHDNFTLDFYTETAARNTPLFNVIQIHWIHSFQ